MASDPLEAAALLCRQWFGLGSHHRGTRSKGEMVKVGGRQIRAEGKYSKWQGEPAAKLAKEYLQVGFPEATMSNGIQPERLTGEGSIQPGGKLSPPSLPSPPLSSDPHTLYKGPTTSLTSLFCPHPFSHPGSSPAGWPTHLPSTPTCRPPPGPHTPASPRLHYHTLGLRQGIV